MLSTAARLDHGKVAPKRGDVDAKVRNEFARLHDAGVNGRTILIITAGLHAFARSSVDVVGRQWIGSRRHAFAIARLVLQSVRRAPPPMGARVRAAAGEQLLRITEPLLIAMEPAFARQQSAAARQACTT